MTRFRILAKELMALSVTLAFLAIPAMADEKLWPKVKSTITADQALEDQISVIMADMSLREKVGQLIMAEIKAISPKDARRNHIVLVVIIECARVESHRIAGQFQFLL